MMTVGLSNGKKNWCQWHVSMKYIDTIEEKQWQQ